MKLSFHEQIGVNLTPFSVVNLSNKDVILKKGDQICQIILRKTYEYEFIDTNELPESERGLGGFDSTGKK